MNHFTRTTFIFLNLPLLSDLWKETRFPVCCVCVFVLRCKSHFSPMRDEHWIICAVVSVNLWPAQFGSIEAFYIHQRRTKWNTPDEDGWKCLHSLKHSVSSVWKWVKGQVHTVQTLFCHFAKRHTETHRVWHTWRESVCACVCVCVCVKRKHTDSLIIIMQMISARHRPCQPVSC